ncbi:MAG: MFS transporter [Thaumarchaeota archaeon]|jgi:MFS family permease|nr:MFS transporter [Candidatus Wolframiiraptor allenii]
MISRKLLWALCFSSYIFYAITATEIGSVLPGIRSELALSESLAGIIASLQSLAGVLAVLGGALSDLFGKMRLVSLSLMIMGLGALLISGSPSALILGASFFIIGAGIGFFEASVNAFVSDIFSERRGMAINLLHIGWNIGSALGPVLAAYIALSYGSWRVGYLMMSPLLLASFAASLITGIKLGKNESSTSREPRSIKPKQVLSILPLMMIPFLIVANQLGITTWLPSILSDQGASLIEASLAVGLFWGLSGLGRLLWAPFIDRIGYWKVLMIAGGFSSILMLSASFPISVYTRIALWSSSGLLLAPAYPTIIAWVTSIYPEIGGALSGMVYAFATLGSFISTIATGMLFELFGSTYAQLIFAPLAALIAMAAYLMRGAGGRHT